MRKSVGKSPTADEQTQQKPCRTSSDIGAELENHIVGRGLMKNRKGLSNIFTQFYQTAAEKEICQKDFTRNLLPFPPPPAAKLGVRTANYTLLATPRHKAVAVTF
jgi:hypothetical protein